MKPKAYSYVRMSTDVQLKGDSLRRQTEESKRYCEENGLELVEDFKLQDIGVSAYRGKNVTQGELGRFLSLAENGMIPEGSFLIVESLDRISREKPQTAVALFLQILESGVDIVTLTDRRVYKSGSADVADILLSVVIMARAYEESRTKGLRVGAAWENKRNNIRETKLTQVAPAWLSLSEDRRTFNAIPERVAVLQAIFNNADNGKGSYQIARKLNLDKIPTFAPSKGWHESYVSKLLTNRAVLGEFQPHRYIEGKRTPAGEPITDYFPAVVSLDQFERIQAGRAVRKNRGSGRKGRNNVNLFSGVATCGYCNGRMMILDKGSGPKGGIYIRCENARRGNECLAAAWPLKHLETAFLTFVKELDLPSLIVDSSAKADRLIAEGRLAAISNELTKKKKMRESAFDLLSDESVGTDFVREKLADLASEIQRIEKEQVELKFQTMQEFARQDHSDLNIQKLVEAISAGPKENLDSRIGIADWIRRNVPKMMVYPDGHAGPQREIDRMASSLDPHVADLLNTSISFARRNEALVDGSHRRFVVGFGGHRFRAVEVDRNDPTKQIVMAFSNDENWGIERGG
ncbi:recombinase family protein [Agrobacterium larrymoorei]|uniref:Recombinase family protein n=1 Tax=Agrobacterium larrymoorei TaxID=160699 RepID=A0A4D7DX92_9HYPH|nr:recombinase family protein [Agrobacterium larrymoorei]QCJ00068.1 recombinase family protein [Agrobacterium larrymoorei]QYA09490.1 recombinase family protein [Agrobacterium larrymoorei]